MTAQYQLQPGVVKKLFDAVAPTAALNSAEFALPYSYAAAGRRIRWAYGFTANPSALAIKLQGTMNPMDAAPTWFDLDSKTTVTGDTGEVLANVEGIRARVETITGGTALTLYISI